VAAGPSHRIGVHPQHRVLIEVRLLRRAALDENLLKPRRADAIEHRTLHL